MTFDFDLDRRIFLNGTAQITNLDAKVRDRVTHSIRVLQNGSVIELPSGTTLRFSVKAKTGLAGGYLVTALGTQSGSGTSTQYAFDLNFNTVEMIAAIGTAETLPCYSELEIEWTSGQRVSSKFLNTTVDADLNRGDEGDPTAANPERQLRDSTNTTSVNWEARELMDSFGGTVADWGLRALYGANVSVSMTWGNRMLHDSTSVPTVDWEGKKLREGWTADGGFRVGAGGELIADIRSATATLNTPLPAGGAAIANVTVTGVTTANTPSVALGWDAAPGNSEAAVLAAWVSGDDTVSILFYDMLGNAVTVGETVRVTVTQF